MACRILHLSDLHFGRPSIAAQVEEVESLLDHERFHAIVISGDLSQRARPREFDRARDFIEGAQEHAPILVVPGNHDTAWWNAPMGIGSQAKMYARYRAFICADLEPVLRIPGVTIVGLNSAHGIQPYTLTFRLRDLSVVGAIRDEQWAKATSVFDAAPAGDLKMLVFHHNLLRGDLSNRWGLANRARGIEQALATGAQLVLCGHDHDEKVDQISIGDRKMVVACASTLTNRVRGDRSGSVNYIDVDDKAITVTDMEWSEQSNTFARAKWARYGR
jgi:3',5'-cyclic AMP phosphodiesterase CpdA